MGTARRWRWLPLVTSIVGAGVFLVMSGTSVWDILRYLAYALFAVILPGTITFRLLRRSPHTLVEDVAMGAAVGLVLELAAWAVFSVLGWQEWVWLWPVAYLLPLLAFRRVRAAALSNVYPTRTPLAWSWSLAGVVIFFAGYLYGVFYAENPIVPDSKNTVQFLDLAYQLSLAGEAKHHIPPDLPQVAGEPLYYHWFSFAHLAMGSLVGHIDLPVLTMRLMVLGICALTAVLVAVAGWRLTGRSWAGIVAAVLFFVIGDFDFAAAGWPPFGTQVTFVVWPSLSMTYSWAILVALIIVTGDALRADPDESAVPRIGPGAYVLTGLFALVSSAAKASSLPVIVGGLALAGLAMLIANRRIPFNVVLLGILAAGAQVLAFATVFDFQRYGLSITPWANIRDFWSQHQGPRGPAKQLAVMAMVWLAFLFHLQLRGAGIVALVWLRRARLSPVQWFLLGGAISGPALHLMLSGYAASWFTRAGFPFQVLLSAWGYAMVFERANLGRRAKTWLAAGSAGFALVLCALALRFAPTRYPYGKTYSQLLPILYFAAALSLAALIGAGLWFVLRQRFPALRGRGWLVLLTAVLLAGAPGLLLDVRASWGVPGGPYEVKVPVTAARAEAGRWVRDHSAPDDVVATNSHCALPTQECDVAQSFWLSAYAERSVLIEGWAFAPRVQATPAAPFWDSDLFALNEDAFYHPSPEGLRAMHDAHRVRYLVVARDVARESPDLATMAKRVYDNGDIAVYELN
jgi:hypothetical protein